MESNGYFSELIKQYSNHTLDKEEVDMEQIRKKTKLNSIKETNITKSKLVEVERVQNGRVNLSVYYRYFKTISWFWCLTAIITYALMQSAQVGSSVWLSAWSKSKEDRSLFYLLVYGKFILNSLRLNKFN